MGVPVLDVEDLGYAGASMLATPGPGLSESLSPVVERFAEVTSSCEPGDELTRHLNCCHGSVLPQVGGGIKRGVAPGWAPGYWGRNLSVSGR